MVSNNKISLEIQTLLDKNKIDDLTRFIDKRHCLNNCNSYLIYLFHIIQSAGILTTTIATGYGATELIWVGVGLNVFASLINVIEQTNNSISLRIMKDIQSIHDDTYVDEGLVVLPINDTNKTKSDKSDIIV